MRDDVKAFVINMRICCGDVQLGYEDECAVFCANPRDVRDGEARFCRQWLVKDAADLIESLAAELEQVKQERDGLNILLGQAQSMLETRTRERDAAVEDIERAESAAEDMRHLLDTDVHPNCDYGLYMSLHDALSDIVAWNHDVSRGTKED